MKILLDTCAFLWLTTDDPAASERAKSLFRNPENPVYLSSVSIWEIIVKHQIGKLDLPAEPISFIPQQCRLHSIDMMSLDADAI